jgi:hypothetical protein
MDKRSPHPLFSDDSSSSSAFASVFIKREAGSPGEEFITVTQVAAEVPSSCDQERGGEEREAEQKATLAAAGIDLGNHGSGRCRAAA